MTEGRNGKRCGRHTPSASPPRYLVAVMHGTRSTGDHCHDISAPGARAGRLPVRAMHELQLFCRNDGVTETAQELLALPEDQVMASTTSPLTWSGQ